MLSKKLVPSILALASVFTIVSSASAQPIATSSKANTVNVCNYNHSTTKNYYVTWKVDEPHTILGDHFNVYEGEGLVEITPDVFSEHSAEVLPLAPGFAEIEAYSQDCRILRVYHVTIVE